MESFHKFQTSIKKNSWISCTVEGDKLRLQATELNEEHIPTTSLNIQNEFLEKTSSNISQTDKVLLSDTLNWLDEDDFYTTEEKTRETMKNKNGPYFVPVPLGTGEEFCYDMEEIEENDDSNISGVFALLDLDEDDEIYELLDNGKILPLFISQLLSCDKPDPYFKLGDITFKKALIIGTVVETSSKINRNIIKVDDGTGQLKCVFQGSTNNNFILESFDSDGLSSDSQLYEANQMMMAKLKEMRTNFPTFSELNIGDKVCLSGDISFYKEDFYMFIKNLERYQNLNAYVSSLKWILKCHEDLSSYDHWSAR